MKMIGNRQCFLVLSLVVLKLVSYDAVNGLENGLARTPPMGWMSWNRFRCNVDCKNDPLNCISENLFKSMAEEMIKKGFARVGYEYVIIDDCWLAPVRDTNGRLQADPKRFPSGIKALADYIHSLGLKLGIYEDYGLQTCGGYPGLIGHLEQDAKTFAEWEIDYIKVDGCYADAKKMDEGYPEFGKFLNQTQRPIIYSCSWPDYQLVNDYRPNYQLIAKHCNLWRNYNDINDSWKDLLDIIDNYGENKYDFAAAAGPGHWNDPDMLVIGNFGLSLDQARVQMALWAVLASPLIMSNDLRTIRPEFSQILLNLNVIKINQDPLGIQGRRIVHGAPSNNDGVRYKNKFSTNQNSSFLGNSPMKDVDIYVRPIMPVYKRSYSAAVAVLYRGTYGTPVRVTFTPKSIGLNHASGYMLSEVFAGQYLGEKMINEPISFMVNPTGVQLLRLNVIPKTMVKKQSIESLNQTMSVLDFGTTGFKKINII